VNIPNLTDILVLLANGAGIGSVVAFLLEHVGAFQRLAPETKRWVVLAICLVVPVIARVALQFVPPSAWAVIEPYWQSLAAGFLVWLGSQVTYRGLVKS